MRISTIVKIVAVLIVAVIVTAIAILYSTDFNAYKGEISSLVRDATGRDLVIDGNLSPKFGLTPAIAVDGVHFANAPWGTRKDMARIGKFRAEVELLPILFGDIRIKQIVLSGADILLESRADGTGNWVLTPPGGKPAKPAKKEKESKGALTIPTIDKVLIENSVLVWRDGRTGAKTTVKIDRLQGTAAAADAPLHLTLDGSYNGEPVALDATLGSLSKVMSGAPLAIQMNVTAGGAKVAVKGRISHLAQGKGVHLAVSAHGDDLAALRRLAGAPLPSIGPYSVAATVVDHGASWQLKGIRFKMGKSDLGGNVTIAPAAKPPGVTADLTSSLLRTADFADRNAPKKQPKAPDKAPAARNGDGRVFPADPLPLDGLKAANVRLSLRAMRIEAEKLALTNVAADVTLHNGDLVIRPAKAEVAGGHLSADLSLRDTRRTPRLAVDMKMSKLDLGAVVKEAGSPGLVDGRLEATAKLSGAGKSVRAIMAGLDGRIETTMEGGRLDDKVLDAVSTDVLKILSPGSSGDKGVRINCLVGRYDVKGGKLVSRATVFDTDRLLVAGEGGVDLGTEKIDFLIEPKAKNASLAKLAVPVRVGGTLASPTAYPDPGGVAKGALGLAAGIATGGISTVLQGVLSETTGGSSKDACAAALSPGKKGAAPSGGKPTNDRSPKSPADDVKKTIEGIGKDLKGLFGR